MQLSADKLMWVAGVIDAAGKLYISFTRTPSRMPGYRVSMEFSVSVPKEDAVVMDRLRNWLGGGRVDIYDRTAVYRIAGLQVIPRILMPVVILIKDTVAARRKINLWHEAFVVVVGKDHLAKDGIMDLARIRRELAGGVVSSTSVDPITDAKRDLTKVSSYKRELK